MKFDRKNPPPPGGFPIYYVPCLRTRRKRTPLEAPCTNSSRGVLFLRVLDQGTLWIGNPPGGGGGVSFDQIALRSKRQPESYSWVSMNTEFLSRQYRVAQTYDVELSLSRRRYTLQHVATHCNTLQHTRRRFQHVTTHYFVFRITLHQIFKIHKIGPTELPRTISFTFQHVVGLFCKKRDCNRLRNILLQMYNIISKK